MSFVQGLISGPGTVPTANQNVLNVALEAVGKYNYCWGGTAPPCFDCSGFVYWVFNQSGIPLKRAMFEQLNQGMVITMGPPGNRLMNALPGDVVYFGLNNPNPAQNHEGIIASSNGIGSMVNAECTACGPVNITPIGEGSGSEPISAIRRFTSVNTPTGTPTTGTDATLLSSTSNCLANIPVIDVCIWRPSWGRALLGAAFMLTAAALGITGVVLLTGGTIIKRQLPTKPIDFEKLNARLARTRLKDIDAES